MGETRVVDPDAPDPTIVAEAGRLLRAGGVIAHPSDTVWGLAAAARHPEAVERLRALKGAEAGRPFIVLIDEPVRIDSLIHSMPRYAVGLIAKHWPGPLTLIFNARPEAPCRSEDGSIALRCPGQPLTRGLVRECAGLMATTSANRTGSPVVTSGREAAEVFGDAIGLVLDAPALAVASTIVDCRGAQARIVRQGKIEIA